MKKLEEVLPAVKAAVASGDDAQLLSILRAVFRKGKETAAIDLHARSNALLAKGVTPSEAIARAHDEQRKDKSDAE